MATGSRDEPLSDSNKAVQYVLTFGIGGIAGIWLWPRLDGVSRLIMLLFALIAGASIHNGTWLADVRVLRRESHENRKQAYSELKTLIGGKQTYKKAE